MNRLQFEKDFYSTESELVCPYRRLVRRRLFSKTTGEEYMLCYGKRCPNYELYDGKEYCNKAERGDKM